MPVNVGYIVGSTSSQSINRKLVSGVVALEQEQHGEDDSTLQFDEIPIAELAIYNRDRDDSYPAEATQFKQAIVNSDAVLIATPEYNRSIPGVLKNAIDWASRPYGENALRGKPVGIIGASIGAIGTAVAQQHLRTVLAYLDAPTLGQPEAYIEFSEERFADDGTVTDPTTREFLTDWLAAFKEFIGRVASA